MVWWKWVLKQGWLAPILLLLLAFHGDRDFPKVIQRRAVDALAFWTQYLSETQSMATACHPPSGIHRHNSPGQSLMLIDAASLGIAPQFEVIDLLRLQQQETKVGQRLGRIRQIGPEGIV